MSQTAYSVVLRAQDTLSDITGDQWSVESLLREVNSGQAVIIERIPRAYTVTRVVTLVSGGRQYLPSDAIVLVQPGRLIDVDGSTPKQWLFSLDESSLNILSPNWVDDTPSSAVLYGIVYNIAVPREFWTYPPAISGTKCELKFSCLPTPIIYDGAGDWKTAMLSITDNFVEALFEWLLYRSFSRNIEIQSNAQNAQIHKSMFDLATGQQPAPQTQGGQQ